MKILVFVTLLSVTMGIANAYVGIWTPENCSNMAKAIMKIDSITSENKRQMNELADNFVTNILNIKYDKDKQLYIDYYTALYENKRVIELQEYYASKDVDLKLNTITDRISMSFVFLIYSIECRDNPVALKTTADVTLGLIVIILLILIIGMIMLYRKMSGIYIYDSSPYILNTNPLPSKNSIA